MYNVYYIYAICMYKYTMYMSVFSPTTHALATLPWVNYEMLHIILLILSYTMSMLYFYIYVDYYILALLYARNHTPLTYALCNLCNLLYMHTHRALDYALTEAGQVVQSYHGDLNSKERTEGLDRFRSGERQYLVCTVR